MGPQGKLNVAPALNAQAANYLQAGAPQHLILFVSEGLAGGHYNAVPSVSAHGVQVFHVADGDAVVGTVPNNLVLDLLPSHQRAFQKDLGDGAGGQAVPDDGLKPLPGIGNTPAGA